MIKFLKKVWAWVRTDGLLHILVSNLIALYLSGFIPLWIALLVAFLIGVGYEVYQKLSKKGCAEWHDIICDAGGVLLAAAEYGTWALFHLITG